MVQNAFHDTAAGLTITEGIFRLRHFFVFFLIIQQFFRQLVNGFFVCTCQFQCTCFYAFGTFCYITQHQYRFAHGRYFFLQTAAVCHNKEGTAHQVMHILQVQRVCQVDTIVAAQNFMYGFYNGRVFMHSVNHFHVGIFFHQSFYCVADVAEGFTQIFSSVGCHCDDAFVFEVDFIQFIYCECIIFFNSMCQRIDNSVTCNEDTVFADIFLQQVFLCQRCRRKVQVCQCTCQLTVHFFGERLIFIICSQACFYMAYLHLIVVCRQCAGECCGCIAVYQNDIGFFLTHYFFQTCQGSCCDACQSLSCLHDIQVMLGMQVENFQNLIQHFSMLRCYADDAFDFGCFFQFFHQWSHFDGFWSCTEHTHYFDFIHNELSP